MSKRFEFLSTKCVKCAKCLPVCTIYEQKRDEAHSPRGFIELLSLLDDGMPYSKSVSKLLDSCFLCSKCTLACPASLRVDEGICQARSSLKPSKLKSFVLALLAKRRFLDLFARLGFTVASCAGKRHKDGLFLPFSKRLFPRLAKKSFLNKQPDFIDNKGAKTIGFFVGCFANYTQESWAYSFLSLCKKLGVNIDLMKAQGCCAAPHFMSGDLKHTLKMAKKNIEYFEKILLNCEAILVPEATCAAMIKSDYVYIFTSSNEPLWAKRAAAVAKKTALASSWLLKHTQLKDKLKKSSTTLVYHDPCHAKHILGVYSEPRELLGRAFDLVEIEPGCCGFGGLTHQLGEAGLSEKVGKKRAKQLEESGSKLVSAECGACKVQLENALKNSDLSFSHPLELLDKSLNSRYFANL